MKSAFFFHGLTDMIPDECDLATTRDAAKIKDKKYFVPDDLCMRKNFWSFLGARVLSQWGQVRRKGVVTSSPEQKV